MVSLSEYDYCFKLILNWLTMPTYLKTSNRGNLLLTSNSISDPLNSM